MFRKSEVVTSSLPQKVGKKVEKKVGKKGETKNQAREKSSNARKKIEHAKKSSARKKIKHEFCMALTGLRRRMIQMNVGRLCFAARALACDS